MDPGDVEFYDGLTAAADILLEKFAFENSLGAFRNLFPSIEEPELAYLAMYAYELTRRSTLNTKTKIYQELVETYEKGSEQAIRIQEVGLKYKDYIDTLSSTASSANTPDTPAPKHQP